MMKLLAVCCIAVFAGFAVQIRAQEKQTLKLVQTIPLPEVTGRLDHMGVARGSQRAFREGFSFRASRFSITDSAALNGLFAILSPGTTILSPAGESSNSEQFFRKSSGTFPRFKPYAGPSDASEAAEPDKKPGCFA